MPESILRTMKYGFFVHYVYNERSPITIFPDGSVPRDFEAFADGFDVERFASDIASFGVEYVIFTAAHANQNFLYPCEAVRRWGLDSHRCSRDLLGDMIRAVRAKGVAVVLYTHPRDGHDFSPEDQRKTGWNRTDPSTGSDPDMTVFDRQKWNDFVNDCYAELVDRYGAELAGLYLDEGSARGDSQLVVDYPRLNETIRSRAPHLLLFQNYYGNLYTNDVGDVEYSRWREFASRDGSTWPCWRMPVGTVMGSQFWASAPRSVRTADFSPEDMYRYTVLEASANTDGGGVQWAAGPYPDATWETGVAETMRAVGALVNRTPEALKGTRPSPSYPTPERQTVGGLDWGVAVRSADGGTEYLHVLKPHQELVLGRPADGARFENLRVLWPREGLTVRLEERDGEFVLSLDGAADAVDTVLAADVRTK